jgi:hypothetical protein
MGHVRFGVLVFGLFLALPSLAHADFRPDPASVERYGAGYRYPQAGWIVLHIEGEPYERGFQHGRLMAPEIAGMVRCLAAMSSPSAPAEGWKNSRSLVNALFVRRYTKEYLEEMKGIADGAAAAGARFDGRPLDLVDVVSINVWPEVETLPSALEATPTGLEGLKLPQSQPKAAVPPKPMHCSAFAANGPATKDGKIVFGHITMFGLYPSGFFNVWLDVKPSKGHRVVMQTYPAGIQSGFDYYLNDAGLLVTETTLAQTRFDITGMSVASRIRQALQYADNIDAACEILANGNNGLYTNEWLLADTKTNEIAMFELGTHKSKLYRSSKNEWFGGTEGFYWGCNNTKDTDVRLETIPGVNDRPENMCFCCSDRDKKWQELYRQHKGKIDADFGKLAFTTPPLAAYHSIDAKFTTTDLAKDMKSWALFGPPLGKTWEPTFEQRKMYPEIKPLVSNPWTIIGVAPPAKVTTIATADVPERFDSTIRQAVRQVESWASSTKPAWHGTILPRSDADVWLATAFADYEKVVARESSLQERHGSPSPDGRLSPKDEDRLAGQIYPYRSSYLVATRTAGDVAVAKTRALVEDYDWYHVAQGKGVLILQELRNLLGKDQFAEIMDTFGRAHAGQRMATGEFQAYVEKASGKSLGDFFDYWLNRNGLPELRLADQVASASHVVSGEILKSEGSPTMIVALTIEMAHGEETRPITLASSHTPFEIKVSGNPVRVVLDKYGRSAKSAGGVFTVNSFYPEADRSLIVYGSGEEMPANREAAERLQRAIIEQHSNITVPIKADKDVTDEDLKEHHLLLIGRPDNNAVVQRFQSSLPIQFGSRSFVVRNQTYAHMGSAVVTAGENPLNRRYSIVVVAGLSAEATRSAGRQVLGHRTEVVVLPNKSEAVEVVIPGKDCVRELDHQEVKRASR